jgi:hypothetical protein
MLLNELLKKKSLTFMSGCPQIFINIYKQVIFQHKCIVSPVQSTSGKALHCAWHFHRWNSSVLSYLKTGNDQYAPFFFRWLDIPLAQQKSVFTDNIKRSRSRSGRLQSQIYPCIVLFLGFKWNKRPKLWLPIGNKLKDKSHDLNYLQYKQYASSK